MYIYQNKNLNTNDEDGLFLFYKFKTICNKTQKEQVEVKHISY